MHSAEEAESFNLYKGSGKIYKQAEKKYGKKNFKKEILKYFNSREELSEGEKILITEEIAKDPKYYNIQPGGLGGAVGEFNPMWGKTHTPESIAKGKAKHRLYGKPALHGLKIIVDGVLYGSCLEAAKYLPIGSGAVQKRVKSSSYLNYRYADESKNTHKSQKFVKINESYYESLRKAEEQTGIPRKLIADNIKNSIEGYCYETLTALF